MARLDWTTFLATHPQAHLLAGHVPEPNPTVLKRLRRLMQALIDGEAPAGDYATAIVRRRDITEIQCGFADRVRRRTRRGQAAGEVGAAQRRVAERAHPAARRASRGRAGRRRGRPQADVTSRPCRPRPGLDRPAVAPRRPAGGLGRRSSITDHAENTSNLELLEIPVFRGFAGFSARRQRPARPAGAVRSTVDVNKGDPGRPGAH